MTTPSRRRWSYSLRTMFVVVTVFALFMGAFIGWFKWARRWSAEREAFVLNYFADFNAPENRECNFDSEDPSHGAPWLLRPLAIVTLNKWAAASPLDMVFFDDDPEELLERARQLFPETEITRDSREYLRFMQSPASGNIQTGEQMPRLSP